MSDFKKSQRAITVIVFLSVLSVFMIAAQAISQTGGSHPITSEDVRYLLDQMRRDHETMSTGYFDKVNTWVVIFGGSVVVSLVAALKILWSSLNKTQKQLQSALETTIQEVKKAASEREMLFEHLEHEVADNLVSRAKFQSVLGEMVNSVCALRQHCQDTWKTNNEKTSSEK